MCDGSLLGELQYGAAVRCDGVVEEVFNERLESVGYFRRRFLGWCLSSFSHLEELLGWGFYRGEVAEAEVFRVVVVDVEHIPLELEDVVDVALVWVSSALG